MLPKLIGRFSLLNMQAALGSGEWTVAAPKPDGSDDAAGAHGVQQQQQQQPLQAPPAARFAVDAVRKLLALLSSGEIAGEALVAKCRTELASALGAAEAQRRQRKFWDVTGLPLDAVDHEAANAALRAVVWQAEVVRTLRRGDTRIWVASAPPDAPPPNGGLLLLGGHAVRVREAQPPPRRYNIAAGTAAPVRGHASWASVTEAPRSLLTDVAISQVARSLSEANWVSKRGCPGLRAMK